MHRRLYLLFITSSLLLSAFLNSPATAMPSKPDVLRACATRRVRDLPIPFADLDPNHWAFEAVMTLYYCGAYRGGIPREVAPQPRS